MLKMPELLTVSTKGQITLPVDLRVKYDLKAGDKVFAEEVADGFIIRRPKKGLLEYEGFIKAKYDPEADLEIAMQDVAAHIMGED
jgi:AbrB family looped-hinge helix DNA binding protein